MTTQQEVFFSMVLKVKNFAAKNPLVFAGIPGASVLITLLNTLTNELIQADSGGLADLTGYSLFKAGKRQIIESLSLKISNALAAMAVNTNDIILQKKSDFTSSFWYKASEDELITQANIVKNLATTHALALEPYGVLATDLTTYSMALDEFINVVSDPTLAIDQRKVDKEKVVELLDQIRTLFTTKLDVLMRLLETSNPSMYELYLLARAQDQRSSVAAATVATTVVAGATSTIHTSSVYDENTFYTIQNTGNEAVQFSLSNTIDTEGSEVVLLSQGETRSRQAQNLSPTGLHFTVKNPSEVPVEIKLWVE